MIQFISLLVSIFLIYILPRDTRFNLIFILNGPLPELRLSPSANHIVVTEPAMVRKVVRPAKPTAEYVRNPNAKQMRIVMMKMPVLRMFVAVDNVFALV